MSPETPSDTAAYHAAFPAWSRLTFGSQQMGSSVDRTTEHVRLVRSAMDLALPIHTSRCYSDGQALNILKLAFREDPGNVPPVMAKIYCYNATQIRLDVEEILERLKLDRLPIGQLAKNDHRAREIVDDVLAEGPMFEALCELRDKGLVGHWTFEVFQKFTPDALKALDNDLFDSVGLYFSAVEREADAATWRRIGDKDLPVVAIRGLAGGLAVPDNDDSAGKPGKPERYVEQRRRLADLFEQSGCGSWAEFSIRFLFSIPNVRTTIIGTGKPERLADNKRLCDEATPLPDAIVRDVLARQNDWTAGRTFDPQSPWA
ncbi:MAG: aldo/keto reductase [Phycisphaerae bacterium]|nr:aldo/keto reductase [Phycisphaerae bacterium]